MHKKNAASTSITNYFFKQEFPKKELETNLSRSREYLPKDGQPQEYARGYSQSKGSTGASQSSLHQFRIHSTSRNGSLDKTDRLDSLKPALNLTGDSNIVLIGLQDSHFTGQSPPRHAPRKSLKGFISNPTLTSTQPHLVYQKQVNLPNKSSQKKIDLNLKTSPQKNPNQPVQIFSQNQPKGISARKAPAGEKRKEELTPTTTSLPLEDGREEKLVKWEDCLGGEDVRTELRFGDCLGQGSFAKVYEGFDKRLKLSVAVKVIDKRKIKESEAKKKALVEEEISILSKMDHPTIVKLVRLVEDAKRVVLCSPQIFVVMELCSQGTLSTFARDSGYNRIPEPICFQIFLQIVNGVEYMHEKDFAHRDLKMTNILIDSSLTVKIIDFGFACKASRLHNMYCGTPSYMPPEIVQRGTYYPKPVDIWTLGCVLYKLATNEYPFGGSLG